MSNHKRLNEYRVAVDPNQSPIQQKQKDGTYVKVVAPTVDIPNTDSIIVDGVQKEIRYIASCPSIYVDEQIEKYKFPRDYKSSTNDQIWLNSGLCMVDSESAKNKAEYLDICSYNRDSPHRRPNAGTIFYKVNPVKAAQDEIDNFELELEAMTIVSKAKKDKALLERIGDHFGKGINAGFTHEEILADLQKKAKKSPNLVLAAVAQHQVTMSHTIDEAKQLGIIERVGGKIVWKGTDQALTTFRATFDDDDAYSKLEKHLNSKEGEADLGMINSQISDKRKTELASVSN